MYIYIYRERERHTHIYIYIYRERERYRYIYVCSSLETRAALPCPVAPAFPAPPVGPGASLIEGSDYKSTNYNYNIQGLV